MKILFESYEYPVEVLNKYFSHGFLHTNSPLMTRGIEYVGYFYYVDEKQPSESDGVFILPKVFLDEHNHPFGIDDIMPEDAIDLNNSVSLQNDKHIKECIFGLSVWIYKAIETYQKRNQETIIMKSENIQNVISSKSDSSSTFLDIILRLLDFRKEHKNLLTFISVVSHSNKNKIHWGKTISHSQPYLQKGKPVYADFCAKENVVDYEEELLVLFFSVLEYIRKKYFFKAEVDVNYRLLSCSKIQFMIDSNKGTRLLKSMRKKYFSDELVALWQLLYVFFDKAERIANKRYHEDVLLVRDFPKVFEDMIDYLISDDDYPKELKEQEDGKIIDHIYVDKSLINKEDNIYYVGDSKYYKIGADLEAKSVAKQFTYAKNIIQRNVNVTQGFDKGDKKCYFSYRDDEVTYGYDITPNFFISAKVNKEIGSYSYSQLQLENISKTFEDGLNRHFHNRLFDRDTLILQRYNINFLYVLSAYATQDENNRITVRKHMRQEFHDDLQKVISDNYKFYLVDIPEEEMKQFVQRFYWKHHGRFYSYRAFGKRQLIFATTQSSEFADKEKIQKELSCRLIDRNLFCN